MILLWAAEDDPVALTLRERWGARARRLTPRDLTARGWVDDGATESGRLLAEGEVFDVREVEGVLTRLPGVGPAHLRHIVPEDREYVAFEATAFMASWLERLPCLVANRPAALNLTGSIHGELHWAAIAARAGFTLAQARYSSDGPGADAADDVEAVVVADRCFGAPTPESARCAVRLGRLSRSAVLGVRLGRGGEFRRTVPAPDLTEASVSDALFELFARGVRA